MDRNTNCHKEDVDHDDEFPLPGFRFHPTDEELVGFYLRRKISKKPIGIEIIKQIDIYKYDPWDLTKFSSTVGEKECFFFCKRGRKYKNSIRPNRVTGSGFWKATGIDKPVYSNAEGQDCIGLKKTLVYYHGSAGKGTKTDWMMHEFRLPSNQSDLSNVSNKKIIANNLQFAEIWTLCKIFKRNSSRKRFLTDCKELSAKRSTIKSPKSACMSLTSNSKEAYIVFGTDSQNEYFWEKKTVISYCDRIGGNLNSSLTVTQPQPTTATFSSDSGIWMNQNNADGFFQYDENWDDDFGSVVEFAQAASWFDVNN